MTGSGLFTALRRDPDLARIWAEAGLDPDALHGVGASIGEGFGAGIGAATGERGCVVVLTSGPVDADRLAGTGLAARFATALGVPAVDVLAVHGTTLRAVVRDWLYQAAQGSGRGVSVRLAERGDGDGLDIVVSSPDSSAREVALRLGSEGGAQAPAARALARALGVSRIEVRLAPET